MPRGHLGILRRLQRRGSAQRLFWPGVPPAIEGESQRRKRAAQRFDEHVQYPLRRRLALCADPSLLGWLYGDEDDQLFETGEVPRVPGVEPGAVRMCGRGDEQVHDPTPGLTADIHYRCCEATVADRHCLVDR